MKQFPIPTLLLYVFFVVSFLFWELTPIPMSISTILIVVAGLWRGKADAWRNWKQNKVFVAMGLLLWLPMASFLWSENMGVWLDRTIMKLPFFLLPLGVSGLEPLTERQYRRIFEILMLALCLANIGVLINYYLHFEEVKEALRVSKNVPTPINHIRFSLLSSLAAIASLYFWAREAGKIRWLYLGAFAFLVAAIHICTVRSGLVALYMALACFGLVELAQRKKWWLLGVFCLAMMVAPYMAYRLVPNVYNKVHLTFHNFHVYKHGEIGGYSDTRRMLSYQHGLDIAMRSPLLGTGAGDLKGEMEKIYIEKSPGNKPLMPHNQYLFSFAALGVLGLLSVVVVGFLPLFYQRGYQDSLFLAFNIIALTSFMTEMTLETQVGVAFYSFFLTIGLRQHVKLLQRA